jgi:prepilin-type N-terminal cleavage/methylation domain-containing protein
MLADGEPSLPFCLCWANEPWTRRWDGRARDVIMPQQHEPARDQPRVRGAVVIEVRIRLRDDRGFTLTELLVVMSLLGMVLTVAYAALQLTFQSGDIQRRNAFVSTSITEPLQLMDVVISQNLSIDSGSGDYQLSLLTDQNADNTRERHVYQATNDGRLVETVYNVAANDANASLLRSTVWQKVVATSGSRNTNVLKNTPLFTYYKTDDAGVLTPSTPGEATQVVVRVEARYDSQDYYDQRRVYFRNR